MHAIFFALISYIGWGIGDIFGTIATRKIGSFSTTFWRMVFGLLIFSIYIPFALSELQFLTLELLLINVIVSIVGIVGLVAFNESVRVTNAALAGTIAVSYPVPTLILSQIFFKEHITNLQMLAILIIFFGLLLSLLDFKELKRGKVFSNPSIL